MKLTILISATILALSVIVPVTRADDASPASPAATPDIQAKLQAVTKERFSVCADKKAGDPCTFNSARGDSIEGACQKVRHGKLICARNARPKKQATPKRTPAPAKSGA